MYYCFYLLKRGRCNINRCMVQQSQVEHIPIYTFTKLILLTTKLIIHIYTTQNDQIDKVIDLQRNYTNPH